MARYHAPPVPAGHFSALVRPAEISPDQKRRCTVTDELPTASHLHGRFCLGSLSTNTGCQVQYFSTRREQNLSSCSFQTLPLAVNLIKRLSTFTTLRPKVEGTI